MRLVAVSGPLLRYGFTMSIEFFSQYWALLLAGVIAAVVLLVLLFRVYHDSTSGRFQVCVAQLREQERAAEDAQKSTDKAVERCEHLQARAESIKPLQLQEASEALEDARALQKIANDQVLIARNQVRKIILEEYPPKRHAALRLKHLKVDEADNMPFTMGESR